MNLTTRYLGFTLKNPLMPGASPLVDNLDTVKRLEDGGAAAIVMHSLFEEQVERDADAVYDALDVHGESFAEARNFWTGPPDFALGPDQYLEQLQLIKESVRVPVIASLNGTHTGGWIDHAALLEQAGADALELNIYFLPSDPSETGQDVERRILDIVRAVRETVSIPLAVKLAPWFSSLTNFARQLDQLGVDGLVLFNRFYQPDIDIENLEAVPRLGLSHSDELRLRLRWMAILFGNVKASLAVTGGVHQVADVIKAVMAGASGVQIVSALLRHGPSLLPPLLKALEEFLEENEYESLEQMRGSMSLLSCPNPEAFERANYLRTLQMWRG